MGLGCGLRPLGNASHLQDVDARADEPHMVSIHVPDERQEGRYQASFCQGAAAGGGGHQSSDEGQQGLHEGQAVPIRDLAGLYQSRHGAVHEQRQQPALAPRADG